jgi:hypothetical protein
MSASRVRQRLEAGSPASSAEKPLFCHGITPASGTLVAVSSISSPRGGDALVLQGPLEPKRSGWALELDLVLPNPRASPGTCPHPQPAGGGSLGLSRKGARHTRGLEPPRRSEPHGLGKASLPQVQREVLSI